MTKLDFDQLREANLKRCEAPDGFNHRLSSWSLLEWAGAMCGEAGEAANIAKKMRKWDYGDRYEEATQDLADELADVVTYVDLLAARLGVDLGKAVSHKFNRVSERIGSPIRLPEDPSDK